MKRLVMSCAGLTAVLLLAACTGNTLPATNITPTTATLNAQGKCGDTGNQSANCYYEFRWGTDPSNLDQHGPLYGPAGNTGANPISVSQAITGLTPNTTYYYAFCGKGDGESNANDPEGLLCVGPDGKVGSTDSFKSAQTYSGTDNGQIDGYGVQANELPAANGATLQIAAFDASGKPGFQVLQSGINLPWPGSVGAYPSLYLGCHPGYGGSPSACVGSGLPMTVSDALQGGTLTTSGAGIEPDTGTYDVAYDIWINAPGVSGIGPGTQTLELMVFEAAHNMNPATQQDEGDWQNGQDDYHVSYWPGDDHDAQLAVFDNQAHPGSWSFDLAPLLQYAVDKGWITSDYTVQAVELGTEIWSYVPTQNEALGVSGFQVTAH